MKRYQSKIDPGIILFLSIVLGGFTLLMIFLEIWLALAILLLLTAFICYIFATTYYVIHENILRVRCGFMIDKSINIGSIKQISESTNPLSSPANSLERLEIHFNKFDRILISPKDKADLIMELKAANPNIILSIALRNNLTTRHQ